MESVLSTAVSGLQVSQLRLSAAANNVANAQTNDFRRDLVRQQAQPDGGGVTARVEKAPQPGADLVQDMVDQKAATYAFKANVQVVKTADDMLGRLLDVRA